MGFSPSIIAWVTAEPWTYANWNINEPSNTGPWGNEYSLQFHCRSLGPVWNDVYGLEPIMGYIVEAVPEPATFLLIGLGGIALRRRKA